MTDNISGRITTYKYDNSGRLMEYFVCEEGGDNQTALNYEYDDEGRLLYYFYTRDYKYGSTVSEYFTEYSVEYNDDNTVQSASQHVPDGYDFQEYYSYDSIGRVTQTINRLHTSSGSQGAGVVYGYAYAAPSGTQTVRIYGLSIQYQKNYNTVSSENYTYEYNSLGYLTKVKKGGTLRQSYAYDSLGQLVRENNADTSRTYVYTYDIAGNILSKKTYSYTTSSTSGLTPLSTVTYSYSSGSWGDLMTSLNDGSTHSISYDNIGNPTNYYVGNKNYSLSWTQGRRLAGMIYGSESLSFTYNDEGIRTSKTVNGVTHYYTLSGSRILSEEWTEGTTQHLIVCNYDVNGQIIGMSYRNSTYSSGAFDSYLFAKNLQGDIIYIYDESGNKVVTYTYDAWGNVTTTYSNGGASTAASLNPFRYRGYYYDTETKLYYLQSRYYNAEIGRFINADGQLNGGLLGYNQFAYCVNNPVGLIDESGNMPRDKEGILLVDLFGGGAGSWLAVACLTVAICFAVSQKAIAENPPKVIQKPDIISLIEAKRERTIAKEKEAEKDETKDLDLYNYWAAELIGNRVVLMGGLTVNQASDRVKLGGSIMCRNQDAARHIIFMNGYHNPVGPEKHGDAGYYWHYHPTRNHTGSKYSTHIWYFIEDEIYDYIYP